MQFSKAAIAVAACLAFTAVQAAPSLTSQLINAAQSALNSPPSSSPQSFEQPLSDAWGNSASSADPRHNDERFVDERQRSPSSRANARAPAATPSPAAAPAAAPVAAPGKVSRKNARATTVASSTQAQIAGCVNVRRMWDAAATLADRGQEDRAYSAYLGLLQSCESEQELTGTLFQAQRNLSAFAMQDLMHEPVLAAPALAGPVNAVRVQQMFAANKKGDKAQALALSRKVRSWLLRQDDPGALEVSGWLEHEAGDSLQAEQLFRAALQQDASQTTAAQGLVTALLSQHKVALAQREADKLRGPQALALQAQVRVAQAQDSLRKNEFKQALAHLEQAQELGAAEDRAYLEAKAWALKGSGQNKEAASIFLDLYEQSPQDAALAKGAVQSLAAAKRFDVLRELSADGGQLGQAATEVAIMRMEAKGDRRGAAALRGEVAEGYGGGGFGGVAVRSKSGDQGEGRLTLLEVPVLEASAAVGESSSVHARVTRMSLSDGVHSVNGTELRIGGETQINGVTLQGEVGVSKAGQSSAQPVFEAKATFPSESGATVSVHASRQPVMDSVRSYAGVQAQVGVPPDYVEKEEIRVGRVMNTQAGVSGVLPVSEDESLSLHWGVSAGSVKGENSPNNGFYSAQAALMKDFDSPGFSWLTAGPYLSVGSFERDENRFDGAFGGYFSPKSDVSFGVRGNLMTDEGGKSLHKASGQVGFVSRGLHYGNDSGLSLEGTTQSAWLLSSNLILGVGVGVRTSPGYTDIAARVGLTIPFEKRTKLFASDLTGLAPYR